MTEASRREDVALPGALLERLSGDLQRIDPGARRPALLVGLSTPALRHIQPLGSVDGQPPAREVVFEWGSVTKTVTAMLVACAALRGCLSLDEPLNGVLADAAHLPDWISIERLATHTACLPASPPGLYRSVWRDRSNPWANFPSSALLKGLQKTKVPRQRSGARAWRYSNFGYALLGAALERRTGRSYAALVDEWIARPLGLTSLHVAGSPHAGALWPLRTARDKAAVPWDFDGAVTAAGALRGSMHDLLRWGMLVAAPPEPLREPVELVASRRIVFPRRRGNVIGFCLGWAVAELPGSGAEVWLHEGATYGSLSVLALARGARPCAVGIARNRGLGLTSPLDRRTRALEGTIYGLLRTLRQA